MQGEGKIIAVIFDKQMRIYENDNSWTDTRQVSLRRKGQAIYLPLDLFRKERQSQLGLAGVECVFNTLHITSRVVTGHRVCRAANEGMGWNGLETIHLNLMRWLYNGHRDTLQDSYNSPAYNGDRGVRQGTMPDGYGEGGINPLWCLPSNRAGASFNHSWQVREDIPLTDKPNEAFNQKPIAKTWSRNAINKAIKRSKKARLGKPQ